jgi:hypothetical protein
VVLVTAACAPGTGGLQLVAEGEATITSGIAARTTPGGDGFEDGWSLQYERFYVSIGGITVRDQTGAQVALPGAANGDRVLDLRRSVPGVLAEAPMAAARRYDRVGYFTRPVTSATTFVETIPSADRDAMRGVSTWITATATRGARRVRIDWQFREAWEFYDCQRPEGMAGEGVVVREGPTTTLRVSVHGDHWYWQTLGAEGSATRFDPIANADTMAGPYRGNGDGEVTLDELAAVSLADVPAVDGAFNPSGRPVSNLADYMRQTTGTIGHIDGDGVCRSRRAD